ncbi:hypothetical protein BUALT_Bualt01G0102700 [Buddleja alternifolia]|uniref:Uncharacterized protein n=1 Tax=Buddleja alternifolia TaxID=168488 RepID=A0AAV6YGF5_9LAMI|nr:hypothetical protein BUALT_Bualt01G0102700 [Buddleja alternifolia]
MKIDWHSSPERARNPAVTADYPAGFSFSRLSAFAISSRRSQRLSTPLRLKALSPSTSMCLADFRFNCIVIACECLRIEMEDFILDFNFQVIHVTFVGERSVPGGGVASKELDKLPTTTNFGEYVDIVKAGIINPLKVIRMALMDASRYCTFKATKDRQGIIDVATYYVEGKRRWIGCYEAHILGVFDEEEEAASRAFCNIL